jgi:hypothetical protein
LEPPEGGFLTERAMARQLLILYLEPLSARYPDVGDLPQCGFPALFLFVKKPDHKYRNDQTYNVSLWSRDMLVPT